MLFLFPRLKGTITTEILVFCFFRELHCFPTASRHGMVNTPCPAFQYFPNSKSYQSKYSSSTILGDAVLVFTAQGYDYHRNSSVLVSSVNCKVLDKKLQCFFNSFRTRNRKYSLSGSRKVCQMKMISSPHCVLLGV